MTRLALIAALCGLLLSLRAAGDDPPKKLTPEERKALFARWDKITDAGGEAYQAGKIADAVKAFEEGVRLARQLYPNTEFPDGHANLALSLNSLGVLYQEHRKLAEAGALFRDALEMRKRLYKGDHTEVANSLGNLAVLYEAQGKFAEAALLHKDALEMNRRLYKGDHPTLASNLNRLGFVYQAQGKLAEAEPHLKQSLEMNCRLFKGDHLAITQSLSNLAGLYRDQGKLADAEPLARDALGMLRRLYKGDHPAVAVCLSNVGLLYQAQGKLGQAEPLLKDAVAMIRRLFDGDHPALATGLGNLAELYRLQGKLAGAESLHQEALGMYRRLHPGDHPSVATSACNLAGLYQDRGKPTEAEPLFKEALEMRRRLFRGDHPDVADSLNELAGLYRDQKRLDEAEPLCKASLEMRRRLHRGDHPDLATSLSNVAALYRDQGKLADAEPLFTDALAMHRRLSKGDHTVLTHIVSNLAYLCLAQGKLAEAETLFKDSLGMTRRLVTEFARDKGEGETLTLVGSLPDVRGAFLSAALGTKSAPGTVYPEVWSDKAAVSRHYERRMQAARAVTDPKAAKLLTELGETRRRRAELLLAHETKDTATRKQRDDDIRTLETRIGELERDLRPLLPAVERGERLGKATVSDLQKVLPADAAVVDFLAYALFEFDNSRPAGQKEKKTWRYTAFVVTRTNVAWVDLDTVFKTGAAVLEWREAITSGKDIPADIPKKVRELVWEKVRKELPANINAVYIAPDGDLCRVPWGAIPGDRPGTILLEDFAIATIPHATFLLDKLWPQDPIKNPPSGALVVGGVNFDAEAATGPANRDLPVKPGTKASWQALPGAAAEATGVTSAAEKRKLAVTSLKAEAATPAAVLAALPKAKHAHFATHGFFADPSFRSAFQLDEKDFLESRRGERIGRAALSPLVMTGLVFAGANNPKTPGRGIVTGEALVDLDLSGLELAVLSACETGLGDVAGGEGTFGLQRAFHLAGTRDVIASLWKVPDSPTAALMAEFYRNLWEKNLSPMESLRQAQLTIYRNPGKIAELAAGFRAGFKEVKGDETAIKPTADGKAHPRLWAAFTLSGPGR